MGCLLESNRLAWVQIPDLLITSVCVRGVQGLQEETETERDRNMETQRHVYLSSIVLVYQYNTIYLLTSFQLFPLAVGSSISLE